MNSANDISVIRLLLGFIILILPLAFLWYYRIKLVKSTLISALRMVIQLSLVAVYLEWVFDKNSAWLNSLWVLVMVIVGVFTTIKRASLNWRPFILPLLLSTISSVIIIDAFFIGFVIQLDYVFDAQYFIPITGMVIGNALRHNIVGLRTYFKELSEKSDLYQFLLTNTGSVNLALRPFVTEAVKQAINPLIATMAVIGLISLPGMMTGQILGGSSPLVAIKYQIMIMLAIFVGSSINLFLSLMLSKSFVFDAYQNLKADKVFISKNKGKSPKQK